MPSLLLLSQNVINEYKDRVDAVLKTAPGKLELLPFTPALKLTPAQVAGIEAAYYSRDIWEGSNRSNLSPAAAVFWPMVDGAPNLKWLQVMSAGADQPPYQPSIQRKVRFASGAGANAEPVAYTAFTGLMMLARGFPHWIETRAKRQWDPLLGARQPADLRGQTAIIIGMGHIGATIARCLQAMGVKTIGIRRSVAPAAHFDRVVAMSELDSLLPKCDWLVLACPLTEETRGLMDARRFALLGKHAGFVNIARGEVIDEPALIATLKAGKIRGAYLDVFSKEPLPTDSPLWDMPNVIMTPHNSAASPNNYARGIEIFLGNLGRYLRGERLENEIG
ncbi:MAG: D-2-hydroxyacid dehydrogenase [Burkholderiales bacterium]